MHMRATEIADWLRGQLTAADARGFVVGLTGNVDSTVVAGLCRMAAPDQVVGVLLPGGREHVNEERARAAAEYFGIRTARVELGTACDRLAEALGDAMRATPPARYPAPDGGHGLVDDSLAALEARVRMASLYFFANTLHSLVAGPTNRCDLTIGSFTKYGEGAADVLPLGHLLRSDVLALARDLGVPDSIVVTGTGSARRLGDEDEHELGFSYDDLERYLADGPEAVPPALALRIERLVRQTEHKRAVAAVPGDRARSEDFGNW